MKWYKVKDKKPPVGQMVLVSTNLHCYSDADVAECCIDASGVAWWNMSSRACPDVNDNDKWAHFDLPNK